MIRHFLTTALTLTAVAAHADAQTPPRILALTENAPWLAQVDITSCTHSFCSPALGAALTPWAGGVAHDPRDRGTWISDGQVLTKVDPRNGCATMCPAFVPPFVAPGVEITGLAFNEELQWLFVSYSDNRVATFLAVGCSVTYLSDCFVTVPPNHLVSGLATDDMSQEIYIASSPWLGPLPAMFSEVQRASQLAPCAPLCPPLQIPDCSGAFFRRITGLAYDSCRGELVVSDPFQIVSVRDMPLCAPVLTQCCPQVISSGDPMTGLCILPSTEVSGGNICFGGTAPFCGGMQHVLNGDPTVGNLGFALDLVNAPAGSIAYVFLGLGPCVGPGTTFGGLICNNLLPTSFYNATFTVGVGCAASASIPFPLPNLPFLCGIQISSQYIGQMPPGWVGNYVSNCVTWQITSS